MINEVIGGAMPQWQIEELLEVNGFVVYFTKAASESCVMYSDCLIHC